MTLLIGTISNKHAIITADGLSRVNPTTGAGVGSDTFKKIFPVLGVPVAFAHHGLNILGGKPVGKFIGDYIDAQGTTIAAADIKDIAEDLRSYAEQAAHKAITDPTNTDVVGFWIAGFGAGKKRPELYEICWPDRPVPYKREPVVFGGDGGDFIKHYLDHRLGQFHPDGLSQYSVNIVRQYHLLLYKQAETKQGKTGQVIFGGCQHQLILEKTGWRWTKPPN